LCCKFTLLAISCAKAVAREASAEPAGENGCDKLKTGGGKQKNSKMS